MHYLSQGAGIQTAITLRAQLFHQVQRIFRTGQGQAGLSNLPFYNAETLEWLRGDSNGEDNQPK